MKKVILIIGSLVIYFSCWAQMKVNSESGSIEYQGVIEFDAITVQKVYDRAQKWTLSTLKTGDKMTETNDPNNSRIIGTANLIIDTSFVFGRGYPPLRFTNCVLNFKVIIEVKENRYRYTMSNFTFAATESYPTVGTNTSYLSALEYLKVEGCNRTKCKEWEKGFTEVVQKKADICVQALINSLKKSIEKKDEW